jgi:hypothetical protein
MKHKYKKGDLVLCVDLANLITGFKGELTIGKVYKVVNECQNMGDKRRSLKIVNNEGRTFGYYAWRFKKLDSELAKLLYGEVDD